MNLWAAIEPLATDELIGSRSFTLSIAWLWPIFLVALVFVGYLCVDAWLVNRRNRRISELKRRARSVVLESSMRE